MTEKIDIRESENFEAVFNKEIMLRQFFLVTRIDTDKDLLGEGTQACW